MAPMMSSSSSQTQNPTFINPFDPPKFSSRIVKTSNVLFTKRSRRGVRCELLSADNGQSGVVIERAWESESSHIHSPRRSWTSSVSISRNLEINSSSKSMKKVCLFYCEEMKTLAERVAAQSDFIEFRSINWRTFDDGFPNLFIPNAHGIRGQHVAFLASFSSPGVIFGQISVILLVFKVLLGLLVV